MKVAKPVIILGIIVMVTGIIFYFQGQAVLGPESSFMYSNPDWINYGLQIAISGIMIAGFGIVLKISKKG